MNCCKNLKKFLKKNYKKIIVVCLIMLLLSNKMYENFTTTQALDAVKSTEKKVNDIYYSIDANWVKSKKSIYSQNELKAEGQIISGKGDIIAASGNVNAAGSVNAEGNINTKKLICVGGTCINENVLKRLNKIGKPPTRQGCYLYTESPCKEQVHSAPPPHGWFRDNHGKASHSNANCKKRVKDFNNWCGSKDFKYNFNK